MKINNKQKEIFSELSAISETLNKIEILVTNKEKNKIELKNNINQAKGRLEQLAEKIDNIIPN